MQKFMLAPGVLSAFLLLPPAAYAKDYVITIKDHQFTPREITIPAGQKVKLTVKNQDATPAEFESADLDREKVVGANSKSIVSIGPLDKGSYAYVDDFHRDTTQGTIIAK